ncbi:hypothetical protein Bca52824_010278 [Brassica carinata]|uniref:RING-type E3 ubiquitin transferase n=1 Tax=Brassica carinata TaxID=52824 RepID=A0A8X8B9Z8_BRACI|nr:hypothetical protein Bca52824_010278 [Brassica carinata]
MHHFGVGVLILSRDEKRDTRHGSSSASSSPFSSQQYVSLAQLEDTGNTSSSAKHLESANTMFSFIWWVIGFYWVSAGGQTLSSDAPQLYWLCIIFLGFDVFFVVKPTPNWCKTGGIMT